MFEQIYKTKSGNIITARIVTEGESQFTVLNTTEDECLAFVDTLKNDGFSVYTDRKIPQGSNNHFFALVRDDIHVFINYFQALSKAQVVTAPPKPLVSKDIPEDKKIVTPSISQLSIKSGMSYAIQASDGSFLLIDGGVECADDANSLYEFLCNHTSEKPRISLWIFTHPDCDHVDLASQFMDMYSGRVDIDAVAYQFPDASIENYVKLTPDEARENIKRLKSSIERNYPHVVTYTLRTGDRYYFSGFYAEILWTFDMLQPQEIYFSPNDMSAAIKIFFDNNKTALIFGDCCTDILIDMSKIYGNYLKSDIMQVTHHGLLGGELKTYQLVNPDICLWPSPEARFLGTFKEEAHHYCLGEGGCDFNAWIRDDSIKKRAHYHAGKTVTIKADEI